MKHIAAFLMTVCVLLTMTGCQNTPQQENDDVSAPQNVQNTTTEKTVQTTEANSPIELPDDFVEIAGGTFSMGSPETENWRGEDETQHTVTVSDFAMCIHEVTQVEYQKIVGSNPSTFIGDDLPVDSVSWLEAVEYCNLRSEAEGLTPVYQDRW